MKAALSSKMLISYHIIIWPHNTEDHDLSLHFHENLISHKVKVIFNFIFFCILRHYSITTGYGNTNPKIQISFKTECQNFLKMAS